jgi:predicted  nucleic acid-binding Zn-ribbon protein
VDVREVNELNHRRSEAEEHIEKLDEELKRISSEQRHLEDEAAKLHRKRVGCKTRMHVCLQL